MKSDVVQLVFCLLVLAVGGAAEELMPKALGVGFPVLLMAALFLAPRRPALVSALFAMAAGGCEDALSSLPFATSASFFALAAVAVRSSHMSYVAMAVAYPVYHMWLWLWRPGLEGSVFSRVAASVPVGLVTAAVVPAVLYMAERGAAIGED